MHGKSSRYMSRTAVQTLSNFDDVAVAGPGSGRDAEAIMAANE